MFRLFKQKAFTLIEVLISLFIFAIIAIMTMQGLQSTFEAKHKSQRVLDQLSEIQVAYVIIQEDLEQIINRNAADPRGGLKLAFLVPVDNKASSGQKAGAKSEFGYNRLEFSRTGHFTGLLRQKASDLERVAYFLNEGMLVRHSWRQIDSTVNTKVDQKRLLSNLEDFNIYFVDSYGRKTENWQSRPSKNSTSSLLPSMELPRGIIINFTVKNYGNIEWVFVLPEVFNKA